MWKAQFLDRRRVLIQWVAPDLLMGPHRRPSHHPAPPHSHHHSAYLMVYNLGTTQVERLMGANSQQIAEWYLSHADEVQCGCAGSTWERYCQPAAASRLAREQQAWDKQQYIKELRQRLGDDLPTPPQQQQLTPYLDRALYLFDERFITPTLKGHHLPHRSVKFMCCSQPERLRFKLDPADITHNLRGGARGSSRVHQVVYLFHPFQPFILAVVQDMEAGQPEGVAAFSRLA